MKAWRERLRNELVRWIGAIRRPSWKTSRGSVYRFLTYHRIQSHQRDAFCRQLDRFQKHYNLVAPAEFEADAGVSEQLNLLLTFDDGYREWETFVVDELARRDIQALFFICPDFVGLDEDDAADYCDRYFHLNPALPITREGVHRLAEDHTLGNHLLRHADLRETTDQVHMLEVMQSSQDAFDRQFDVRPAWLAYPFGDYFRAPDRLREAASRSFEYAVTLVPGFNTDGTPQRFLHREGFSPDIPPSVEAGWLKGGYDPIHALTHLGKGG